jgi:uncharacterized protein YycO
MSTHALRCAAALICIGISLAGCLARPVVRPDTGDARAAQSAAIAQEVRDIARTGDWLVTRGYHATDTLVANATGLPLSHAAVYHGETFVVIEAEQPAVHRTPLGEFVDGADRVLVIRPRWRTDENAADAWAAAEALVGKRYDVLGTVGFNFPDAYYCSELAIRVYAPWYSGREAFPAVIKPGELYLYGTVVYDSLERAERVD